MKDKPVKIEHSIAFTDEGEVLTWGAGGAGMLSHGHKSFFFVSFLAQGLTSFILCLFDHCLELLYLYVLYQLSAGTDLTLVHLVTKR
jgi:hypothetical protein